MAQAHSVKVGDLEIANDKPLTIIAGPCQMESRQHAQDMSGALAEIGKTLGIGIIYKTSFDKANRTSISSARGLGLEAAAPVFAEIKETTGLATLTDVHDARQWRRPPRLSMSYKFRRSCAARRIFLWPPVRRESQSMSRKASSSRLGTWPMS